MDRKFLISDQLKVQLLKYYNQTEQYDVKGDWLILIGNNQMINEFGDQYIFLCSEEFPSAKELIKAHS